MMSKPFFIVDTNCFISANRIKNPTSAHAFNKVLLSGRIALSDSILNEYTEVLYREKLDKYLDETKRQNALIQIKKNSIFFSPTETITDCGDPKDNKFLELALASRAFCIISGDAHLLVLHPFRGIPILSPADFLDSSF